MVNFGKVGKYFKKSVLVLLAASVGYYAGIKQKPDFQKFPSSVQQTIKVEHDTLQLELKESITLFSQGKFQEAIKRFEAAKAVAKSMAKIDPRYKELGKRIDSFEMFIRGLEMMTKYVDSEIKKGFKMISIPPTEMDLQYISIQGTNPTMNAIYLNKLIQSGTFKDDRELEDAAKNTMILLLEEERIAALLLREKLQNALDQGTPDPRGAFKSGIKNIDQIFIPSIERITRKL